MVLASSMWKQSQQCVALWLHMQCFVFMSFTSFKVQFIVAIVVPIRQITNNQVMFVDF